MGKRKTMADKKRGEWLAVNHEWVTRLIPEGRDGVYECTACRMWILGNGNIRFYEYCPYCGALMRKEKEKTDVL